MIKLNIYLFYIKINKTMSDSENTQTPYAVVIVFSGWRLDQICSFMEEELDAREEQIGLIRIDRTKGEETNRTIMLIERSLLEDAVAKGYDKFQRKLDFKISEYEIRDYNKPREGFSSNFFIPIKKELSTRSFIDQMETKLNILTSFGMFTRNTHPRLNVPLESRESGEHRGRGFVTFREDTDLEVISMARILLNDTRLYIKDEYHLMGCFWARQQTGKNQGKKKSKRTNRTIKKKPDGDSVPKPEEESNSQTVADSPKPEEESNVTDSSKPLEQPEPKPEVIKKSKPKKKSAPKKQKPKFKPIPKGKSQWSKPLSQLTQTEPVNQPVDVVLPTPVDSVPAVEPTSLTPPIQLSTFPPLST